MRFTVVWKPIAESELAHIYLATADKSAVQRAADRIDVLLARDPKTYGKPRFGDVYVMRVLPLGIEFNVSEQDRQVTVVAIWEIGPSDLD